MDDEGEKSLEVQSTMEELFNKMSISVYKSNGELKNTFEIMQDLAGVYPTLTTAEKAYVTEAIAGKYQAQNAAAILENFGTAVKATETAMNSAGSATKENEKVLESITGKIQNLKSQFELLAKNLISSDFVKFIVDLGTAFLKLANTDVGQFIVKTTMATVSVAALTLALKKMKGTGISKEISNIANKIYSLGVASDGATFKIATLGTSLKTMGKAGASAIASMAASIPVAGWIAAGVVAAVGAAILVSKKLEEQVETNYKNAKKKLSESKKDVSETETEIAKTQEKINKLEGKDSLTDVETSKLNVYKMQLSELKEQLKTQKSQVEKSKEDLKVARKKLEVQTKSKWDDKLQYSRDTSGTTFGTSTKKEDMFKGTLSYETKDQVTKKTKVTDYKEDLKNLKENNSLLEKSVEAEKKKAEQNEKNKEITRKTGGLIKNEIDLNNKNLTIQDKINNVKEAGESKKNLLTDKEKKQINQENEKIMEKLKTHANDLLKASQDENLSDKDRLAYYKEYLSLLSQIDPDKYKEKIALSLFDDKELMKAKNDTETLSDALKRVGDDGKYTKEEIENLKEAFPDLAKYMEENGISVEDLADALTNFGTKAETVAQESSDVKVDVDAITDSINDLVSTLSTLNDALLEQAEYGSISVETALDLIDQGYATALAFDEETGAITLNRDAVIAMTKAKIASQQVDISKKIDNTVSKLEKEKRMCMENANAWIARAKAKAAKGAASDKEIDLVKLAAQQEALDKVSASIDKLGTKSYNSSGVSRRSSSGSGSGGSGKSKSKSSKSEKEWWEKELDNLKDQFEYNDITIEQYIGSLENLLGRVQQGTEAWKKINKELQKQKLQKVEDDYKRGAITLKQYIKELRNLQGAYKAGTDAWLDLADKIKSSLKELLNKQKDAYNTAHNAAMKIIETEIDKINEQKDATEEYYDKLIEDKKKANEESEKEIELAKLQEALANAKREKTKRVKCMLSIKIAQNGETPEGDNTVGKICFEI